MTRLQRLLVRVGQSTSPLQAITYRRNASSGLSQSTKEVQLNSGYRIPLVGFGTYKLRDAAGMEPAVENVLEAGYRLFDTAKNYRNEAVLGNALKVCLPRHTLKRNDIFVTTKCTPAPAHVEGIRWLVEESLENLKTSYIDLFLVHFPMEFGANGSDPNNARCRKEMWRTLEELVGEGLIRSIGVSNYEKNHLEDIRKYGKLQPSVNQVEFHPHFRRQSLLQYCRAQGIFVQAHSSLGQNHEQLLSDPVVKRLAAKYGASVQKVLLAFATSQGIGVIPKSANRDRIFDNFSCTELKLSADDLADLNSINIDQNYTRCTGWLVK